MHRHTKRTLAALAATAAQEAIHPSRRRNLATLAPVGPGTALSEASLATLACGLVQVVPTTRKLSPLTERHGIVAFHSRHTRSLAQLDELAPTPIVCLPVATLATLALRLTMAVTIAPTLTLTPTPNA